MKIHVRLRRLRHLTSIARQKKNALLQNLKETSTKIVTAAKSFSKTQPELENEPEVEIELDVEPETGHAEQGEYLAFRHFVDLPVEIRLRIWKHVAESTTQVVHIAPYTSTGRLRRHFKFYGHYRSLTPFPPFLQVNRELRHEGLRYYSNLVEDSSDFKHSIPFNFSRDILLISLQLSYARQMQQSVRTILPRTGWHKIQNICFQVRDWEMYPWHLDLLDELPNLKELYFTSYHSKEYRENIDQVLDSHKSEWWTVRDCAGMLGVDMYGDVDFAGVDDTDEIDQRPFQFFPLKLEFEYMRLYSLPTLSIKLPCWFPLRAFLSSRVAGNANTRALGDAARASFVNLDGA